MLRLYWHPRKSRLLRSVSSWSSRGALYWSSNIARKSFLMCWLRPVLPVDRVNWRSTPGSQAGKAGRCQVELIAGMQGPTKTWQIGQQSLFEAEHQTCAKRPPAFSGRVCPAKSCSCSVASMSSRSFLLPETNDPNGACLAFDLSGASVSDWYDIKRTQFRCLSSAAAAPVQSGLAKTSVR